MTISTAFPLPPSGYQRTFEAEIDVLAENELLVRGTMRDHRFAFAHDWRLHTPDYAVLEASARQLAGDAAQFQPELCTRYANIRGVKIGRGFSKHLLMALGDLPGQQEHLLLAIEMARVGQQVYQYTPEFEAQFPQRDNSANETARAAWLKDRAYMNLADTCYTYRGESLALFDERPVRCGFGAELTRPKPGDRRVFWRNKRVVIQQTAIGFACESMMDDRIHDIRIEFELSSAGLISNARSRGLRLPYHGICEEPQQRTAGLNGLRVTAAFVQQFAEQVGGASGCTHLFDLSIDVLRLFQFNP
ncbi:MAG: DUF2889 domain-containing protein [Acidobacteria bacterium]|nr:DUF2889 domain-containing protein [Acidobacteriota bacterium]MBI3425704.1 DUF2889 domain-containing protein [Acidobacteriota bacterium]